MGLVYYYVFARDSSTNPPGLPIAGLKPTFRVFAQQGTNAAITPPPIADVGMGHYEFSYDPEANPPVHWQVDFGPSLSQPWDRWLDGACYRSDSRVDARLDAPISSVVSPILNYTPPAITVKAPTVYANPPDLSGIRAELAGIESLIPTTATLANAVIAALKAQGFLPAKPGP